jgi:hypothetical protein
MFLFGQGVRAVADKSVEAPDIRQDIVNFYLRHQHDTPAKSMVPIDMITHSFTLSHHAPVACIRKDDYGSVFPGLSSPRILFYTIACVDWTVHTWPEPAPKRGASSLTPPSEHDDDTNVLITVEMGKNSRIDRHLHIAGGLPAVPCTDVLPAGADHNASLFYHHCTGATESPLRRMLPMLTAKGILSSPFFAPVGEGQEKHMIVPVNTDFGAAIAAIHTNYKVAPPIPKDLYPTRGLCYYFPEAQGNDWLKQTAEQYSEANAPVALDMFKLVSSAAAECRYSVTMKVTFVFSAVA